MRILTVPDGSYTPTSLVGTLETLWNDAFSITTMRLEIDANTGILRVTDTDPVPSSFSIEVPDYVDDASHWGLSFYLGMPRLVTMESVNGVLEGSFPVRLDTESYVLLDIPELGHVRELAIQGRGGSSIGEPFAKLPISFTTTTYMHQDVPPFVNESRPPVRVLEKLRVRLRFHYGTHVDFQGRDHSFTLELLCAPVTSP